MICPDDWQRLEEYRDEVLAAVCERYGVTDKAWRVINRRTKTSAQRNRRRGTPKSEAVWRARHNLICILRTTVFQTAFGVPPDRPFGDATIYRDGYWPKSESNATMWRRLSLPNIGRLVGCDHVTAMNALKRRKKWHGDWRLTFTDYLRTLEAERNIPC